MKRIILSLIVVLMASFLFAETIIVSTERDRSVELIRSDEMNTIIEYQIDSFTRHGVTIDGELFYHIGLQQEPIMLELGEPELPYMSRSIIVPNDALNEVRVLSSEYTDFEMEIVPSKGALYRYQNPSEIPYTFSDVYEVDAFYPETLAELGEPYILRDFRGQVVRVNPFQYNPVTGVLRVHHRLTVEIANIGVDDRNVLYRQREGYTREFETVYQNRFLNFSTTRYTPLEERGRLIVIAYDAFVDATMPYVEWKRQKGIQTDIYPVSTIGANASAIRTFVQNQYDQDDGFVFLQIVGDAPQVPPWIHSGIASDPYYSLLAGNDAYGDIFVGRFSAENVTQLETQIYRTIHYERDMDATDTWLTSAMNLSYNGGPGHGGLYDHEHSEIIRQMLLGYHYTHGDGIYAPSATAAMVTNAINDGRGIANYTGHGSTTSWGTTGFSNSHVNSLVNDYMLPFIISVACVNGNFASTTCFAEAWLRATNNTTGAPTGAVAMYASTRNQLWNPPMSGQMEIANLLVNDQKNTIGGLFFNGSFQMIDDYPIQNQGPNEFLYWHIFGDASLQVRSNVPQAINAAHMNETFIGLDAFEVNTDTEDLLVSITHDGEILAAGYTGADGNITLTFDEPPTEPMELTLTITGYNKITYIAPIDVIPSDGPYVVIQQVNVIGSGENNAVNYGDLATVNIRLRNVGIETAHMVSAELSTDDPYITILDDSEFFGHITPGSNVLMVNAYSLQVNEFVPDQHIANLALEVTDNDDNVWNWNFNVTINSPDFSAGSYIIDDSQFGNNNGYLDPGETIEITIPVVNEGHAVSPITSVTFVSGSPDITIDSEATVELGVLYPNETHYPTFTITASNDIDLGSIYNIGVLISGAPYDYQHSYILSVGPVIEDFETGDFSAHDWTFSGNLPWVIVQDEVYEGNYAARSGTITHSQTSTMSLTIDVATDGEISFYRKVSSESNWDFLRFFINGNMVGQWSGEVPWSQVSYPVQAGNNTFQWTYFKDPIISSGQDCAWVDYIEFPTSGDVHSGPIFLANPVHIDFGTVLVDDVASAPFWIRNFGNETMNGTIETYDGFEVQTATTGIVTGRETGERTIVNYTIPPESNVQFNLLFMPEESMDYSGEIVITSNADNTSQSAIVIDASGFVMLPAENLSAEMGNDHLILTWEAPEINGYDRTEEFYAVNRFERSLLRTVEILGYNIYKDDALVNDVPLQNEYYHDYDITPEETYSYYVTVVYNLGESSASNTIQVTITSVEEDGFAVPYRTELHANYPNPFNPATTISFSMTERGHVQIEVYNILGQKVKTLLNDEKEAGLHRVIWDGTNDSGISAASGIYFYRMQTGDYQRTRKMIFMK